MSSNPIGPSTREGLANQHSFLSCALNPLPNAVSRKRSLIRFQISDRAFLSHGRNFNFCRDSGWLSRSSVYTCWLKKTHEGFWLFLSQELFVLLPFVWRLKPTLCCVSPFTKGLGIGLTGLNTPSLSFSKHLRMLPRSRSRSARGS